MAVSQYLQPGGLVETTQSYLTTEVVRKASFVISEPESATRKALFDAVPLILTGVIRMASSPGGATSLANIVHECGLENQVGNLLAWLSGAHAAREVRVLGTQLLIRIFGRRTSAISGVLAESSGISASSANQLLSLAAPLTIGVLTRQVTAQKLNAFGLSDLLSDHKNEISAATPAGLLRVLDSSGPIIFPSAKKSATFAAPSKDYSEVRKEYSWHASVEERRPAGYGWWLPWLLLALAGLGLFFFLRARSAQQVDNVAVPQVGKARNFAGSVAERTELKSITLPGGTHLSVPADSVNYSLSKYLGSSAEVPITFVVDHLSFEPSATQLTSESYPNVNAMASILKAYPHAKVQLAGYTDNIGDPHANRTLSLNRAILVKAMLAAHGVNSARVIAVGLGSDHPITSNNSESERAQNNRLELTVTSK